VTTPLGSNVYTCEWCTFQGPFHDVVVHERTCTSAKKGEDSSPTMYSCEWRCGFQGIFDVITLHEKTCSLRGGQTGSPDAARDAAPPDAPPPAAATAPATPQPTHTCENRCGFQGSYDAVLAHERTCAAAPAGAAAGAASHGPSLEGGTPRMGGASSLAESPARSLQKMREPPVPTHTCVNLCGYRGSFDAVAVHEKTCSSRARSGTSSAAFSSS